MAATMKQAGQVRQPTYGLSPRRLRQLDDMVRLYGLSREELVRMVLDGALETGWKPQYRTTSWWR
jgi:hypothetical protein